MGNDGTVARIEFDCIDDFVRFLNENDIEACSYRSGILFHVDEGAKVLVKKGGDELQASIVPNDTETIGLIMSILLEKSSIGRRMVFGYLTSFLTGMGVKGEWDNDESVFKVSVSKDTWYDVLPTNDGIVINKHIGG